MALRTPLTAQPHLYIGDSTGRPLDYGRVYFGEPNKDPESYPIDIYLDPEMTIAAAQPVRTKGGFMDVGGNLAELHAAEVVYSLKVLDQYGRQVFYKPEMYRNNVSDFLVDEITRATAAETLIAGNLTAETQRAVAAEKVIADAVVTEKDRAVAAEVALDSKYATLDNTVAGIVNGRPTTAFATKALMTASALVDGDYAIVTDDTVNNGLYVKTAGAWVKSEYDPLGAANKYTDISVKHTISASLPSLVSFVDADYNEVMSLGTDGALNVEDIVFNRETSGNRDKLSSLRLMDIEGFTHIKTDVNYNIIEGHLSKGGTYSANPYEYKGYNIDDMRSKDLDSKTMTQTGLFFDKDNLQKTPMNFEVEVAGFGEDGTLHQRMPATVPIGSNTFFVAYTQFSSPNTDTKDGRLVGKVVQYDLEAQTANVGQLIVIDGEKTGSLSRHPNFIELEDRLVMLFNSGIQLIQVESVDGGVTWGERKEILSTGSSTFLGLNSTISVAKSDGTKRHVIALYSLQNNITLAYSDDDCITWLKGGEIYKDSFEGLGELALSEPSIALDSKGNILVAIRCEQQDKGVLFAVSKDLGATLIPIGENSKALTTVTQKGFAQMSPKGSQGVPKTVITTATIGGYKRTDFRVMLSYDDCNTFCAYYRPYNADTTVGYTHVLPLNDSIFVISMEKGRINAEQSIYLKFMNTAEILK